MTAKPLNRRRAALVNFFFNYTGTGISAIKGIVLVPLYLKHFDLSTYGAWLATGNVVSVLAIVEAGLGLVFGQRLSLSYGRGETKEFQRYVSAGMALYSMIFILLCLGVFSIASWVPQWVHAEPSQLVPLSRAFIWAGVGNALGIIFYNLLAVPYAWQLTFWPGVFKLVVQVGELIAICLLLWTGWGVVALGFGVFVSQVVGLLLATVWIFVKWRELGIPVGRVEAGPVKELAKSAGPLFFTRAATQLLGNTEAAVIASVFNPTAAAVYGLTDRAFKIGQVLINPVAGSVFFGLAHLSGEGDQVRLRRVVAEVVSISAAVTVFMLPGVLALNRSFVSVWVGADKIGSPALNIWICLAALLVTRANLVAMLLNALGEIGKTAILNVGEVILRVPLLFILLPHLGVLGMPVAVVIGSLPTGVFAASRLLSRRLGLRGFSGVFLQTRGLVALLVGLLSAGVFAITSQLAKSWFELVERGAVAFFVAAALVILLNPDARSFLSRRMVAGNTSSL